MKKHLKILIITIAFVCIACLNIAFKSVNEINYAFLSDSSIGSAFSQYDKLSFSVETKPEEFESFKRILIDEINRNKLLVKTEIEKGPEDNYRFMYIFAHPKFNKTLDFYLPIKMGYNLNCQNSFSLDVKNSSLHKPYFIFNHNINISSFDNLKIDEKNSYYGFDVYGDKDDIAEFKKNISERLASYKFKTSEPYSQNYSIFKYTYQHNKASLIMMWSLFILMLFYIINTVIEYSDEISVRKLLGQSDISITMSLMKNITKVTLTTVVIVCMLVNIFFVRSINFMLYGVLLSEFILLLIFGFMLLLCSIFIYLYVKKTVVNQVVKASFSFIKSFNYYQVVTVIILILMIYELGPSYKYYTSNFDSLVEINKRKDTMYKVSSFTGFIGKGGLSTQQLYEKYMSDYYLKSNDNNIHAYTKMSVYSKDEKKEYPVIFMDSKTAGYFGFEANGHVAFMNKDILNDINTAHYFPDVDEIITTDKNNHFTPLLMEYYEVLYENPIVVLNDPNAIYQYYVIENENGSTKKFQDIIDSFNDPILDDIKITSQMESVKLNQERILKGFLRLFFEIICMFLIIVFTSFSLVQLYFNAFKKKLSVMWTLGKSNFELCKYLIYTDVLIYIIVWM
ncbi:MAG: hypothetical protein ACK5KQ_00360, partial [Anaerorhabdus sp.]